MSHTYECREMLHHLTRRYAAKAVCSPFEGSTARVFAIACGCDFTGQKPHRWHVLLRLSYVYNSALSALDARSGWVLFNPRLNVWKWEAADYTQHEHSTLDIWMSLPAYCCAQNSTPPVHTVLAKFPAYRITCFTAKALLTACWNSLMLRSDSLQLTANITPS